MSDKAFIDTNIFVYSFDSDNPEKKRTAWKIINQGLSGNSCIISYQVVQEFTSVALQKFKKPLTHEDIQKYLKNVLMPLCEIFPTIPFYEKSLVIKQETGFSYYDSLIVTAALEGNCAVLYSEDLQHQRKVRGCTIINPFA